MTTNANLLQFAHELADLASAAILPHFRRQMRIENKAATGFDPVTVADTAAERAMRRAIAQRFPNHGIVGEEYGATAGGGRYEWVIDPIDGTRAFMMGYPLWGTLIGLVDRAAAPEVAGPILGMMAQPFTGERFWASAKGAFERRDDLRPRRLRTRACAALSDAVLASTTPDMFRSKAEKDGFARVAERVRLARFGGDCYAYCLLAAGHIDLVVEARLKAVDIVALIPIIERAGGRVTTWDGRPAISGGRIVAAGDPRLHEAALALLSPAGR